MPHGPYWRAAPAYATRYPRRIKARTYPDKPADMRHERNTARICGCTKRTNPAEELQDKPEPDDGRCRPPDSSGYQGLIDTLFLSFVTSACRFSTCIFRWQLGQSATTFPVAGDPPSVSGTIWWTSRYGCPS